MTTPLVSILCLCYNQSRFIVESLESLKTQTFSDYEIIICDDASKDNSVEVVDNWIEKNPQLQIKFIKHEENKGICKSLNEVFKASSGKYIQMLALDDILLPDKLQRHISILDKSSDKEVMVFSDALIINNDSALQDKKFFALHHIDFHFESGNFYDRLIETNFIPAMSVLLKSEVIKNHVGWDENLTYEDYDMWLRLSKNYDFIFDITPSCKYRIHDHNTYKNNDLLKSSYFDIMYKHVDHPLVKEKLFKAVESKYLSRNLSNQHILFYQVYKPKSITDYLIKTNNNLFIYKLIKKVQNLL